MSKKARATRPAAASTPTPPARSATRPAWLIPALVAVGLLLAGAILLAARLPGRPPAQPAAALAPTPTAARAVGPVDGCRAGPRFQTSLSLSDQAALTTSLTNVKGLALIDPTGSNGKGSVYRHETWDDAGFLGPFITDRKGDIYVAPVPLVSLVDNPPELQNRVYRVGTEDETLRLFVELPAALPAGGASPFGVVALAYDCDTESLYAASLAGSTARQEVGRIFQIDLRSGEVVSQLDGVDAMGIGVYNTAAGKRLYFGLARSPEVRSVALDADGKFSGAPQPEFKYAQHTLGGRRTARRIRFSDAGEMRMNMTDFNYSLQVASKRMEDVLIYRPDPATGGWTFDRIDPAK